MIVPAVGVIVHNDDRGAAPAGLQFEEVDGIDDKGLLIQRIGVPGMAVLIGWRLQEADCGKVACRDRSEEVVDIVLVVCRPIVADFSDISRSSVVGVGREG